NSRLINSEEAMRLLSDFRLGNDLKLIDKPLPLDILNELLVFTGPAVLQKLAGRKLPPRERDLIRARILREKLEQK
ncbi:MAG TPA: ATP--guanido phosphotransferase, partial [Firmicutes bacterium]|nr:ATP--guanido phosphotransferase [Bacillota bacterium]